MFLFQPMHWDFLILLIVLAVLVPWRSAVQIRRLLRRPSISSTHRLAIYGSTIAFQWLLTGLALWRCVARQLSFSNLALAISDPARTSYIALGITLALGANQLMSLRRVAHLPPERHRILRGLAARLLPQDRVESLAFVGLAATAALCEEFLYRGFVFAALAQATRGSLLTATLGSSLLFSLAHFYQGFRGVLATFAVGLVFASARIWTASLAPSVLAHFVADVVAGLAARRLLGHGDFSTYPPKVADPEPVARHFGQQ